MSLLGFKKQFAGPVERREKRQTIRKSAGFHVVGGKIQLYTGLRTKGCRKLSEVDPICTSIEAIQIMGIASVWIGGRRIPMLELMNFIHADGFASDADFFAFFKQPEGAPFNGFLIKWDWPPRAGHFHGFRGQGHVIAPGATEMED